MAPVCARPAARCARSLPADAEPRRLPAARAPTGLFPVLPEKVAKAGPSAASATSFPELASINNDQAAFTAGLDSPSGNLGQRMDAHRDFSAQMETLKDDAPWKGYMAGLLATHLARNPKMSPDSKAEMMATMASKLKTINPK